MPSHTRNLLSRTLAASLCAVCSISSISLPVLAKDQAKSESSQKDSKKTPDPESSKTSQSSQDNKKKDKDEQASVSSDKQTEEKNFWTDEKPEYFSSLHSPQSEQKAKDKAQSAGTPQNAESFEKACAESCKKENSGSDSAGQTVRSVSFVSEEIQPSASAPFRLYHPGTSQVLFLSSSKALSQYLEEGWTVLGQTLSPLDLQQEFRKAGSTLKLQLPAKKDKTASSAPKAEKAEKTQKTETFDLSNGQIAVAPARASNKNKTESASSQTSSKETKIDKSVKTEKAEASKKEAPESEDSLLSVFKGKHARMLPTLDSSVSEKNDQTKEQPEENKPAATNPKPESVLTMEDLLAEQPLMRAAADTAGGFWTRTDEKGTARTVFLDASGAEQSGYVQSGEKVLFCDPKTGETLKNTWVADSSGSIVRYFDDEGVMVRNPICLDGRVYAFDPDTGAWILDLGDLETQVRQRISRSAKKGEQIAFALRDVQTGESFVLNSKAQQSASVMKAFVMGAIFDHYEDYAKRFGKSYIDGQLSVMISISDNNAWVNLVEVLGNGDYVKGISVLNAWNKSHGYKDTTMSNVPYGNYTSAKDASKLLYDICNGTLRNSSQMKKLLETQAVPGRLLLGLPTSVNTGNKPGWVPGTENDTMFVETGSGCYVITLLCDDIQSIEKASALMKELSSLVYSWMTKNTLPAKAKVVRYSSPVKEESKDKPSSAENEKPSSAQDTETEPAFAPPVTPLSKGLQAMMRNQ